MNKHIEKIKDCIDSVYGSDCAYYGVDGLAIAAALYKAGCRFQSEKYLIKENGDILPIPHHSEWISVEDRLPDREGETVLYYDGNEVDACNFYFEKFHTIDLYESDIIDGVTHWMPLPEAPKGGGKE